ncbi:MAG: acetate kinase [Phycisphaerae bacterium]
MIVFVVNCGSSSIKYQLFDMADESVLAKGLLERIGTAKASLSHKAGSGVHQARVAARDHTEGLRTILDMLVDPKVGVIKRIAEIDGVGHRVVHGGEQISASSRIDGAVLDIIRRNADIAPLHNPPNLAGIEAAMAAMPDVPQVAVFDTAFLATLPPRAYRYAVPDEWYTKHHVRKYGFHGTSHRYVTLRTAELLHKPLDQVNLITTHLGNGCSMTAVAGGKAVDHSMGLTPLEGLVMGTRSGDVDPALVLYMISQGMSRKEVDAGLNKGSGLLGVSGLSNDMRDLLAAADGGNARAALAVEMFVYRVAKYVGAYYTAVPAVDAVVLTGGIGENAAVIRWRVMEFLRRLGAVPDEKRNAQTVGGKCGPITADGSPLAVWVVPTNEELMIARDTKAIVDK